MSVHTQDLAADAAPRPLVLYRAKASASARNGLPHDFRLGSGARLRDLLSCPKAWQHGSLFGDHAAPVFHGNIGNVFWQNVNDESIRAQDNPANEVHWWYR